MMNNKITSTSWARGKAARVWVAESPPHLYRSQWKSFCSSHFRFGPFLEYPILPFSGPNGGVSCFQVRINSHAYSRVYVFRRMWDVRDHSGMESAQASVFSLK